MAETHYEIACKALPVIAAHAQAGRQLRYTDLCTQIARPQSHFRVVAAACNLLDSAAVLAGRPLMALWTVVNRDWKINPDAWQDQQVVGLKAALIEESRHHRFTNEDEKAVRASLDMMKGLSAQAAWAEITRRVPHEDIMARLMGREPTVAEDSCNDLDIGSDVPLSMPAGGRRFVRDPRVRFAVLERAEGRCEFCGEPGFISEAGTPYLEAHHILALSQDGQDRRRNVIALCPLDHRRAHLAPDKNALNRRMAMIVHGKEK